MQETITALLVHDGEACFPALKTILESQGIVIREAPGCAEALTVISQLGSPHLLFTHTSVRGGSWADVLKLAAAVQVRHRIKVIVVSRVVNCRLYLDAIEGGAFDLIVPPFRADDIAYIVRSAILSAQGQRGQLGASLPSTCL